MMSGLGALAPVPGRKELSNKDLNLSDDDFDAMLDDMLDSPTKKGSTRPSKQKNQSSNREQTDNTYDMTSIDSSQNSDSFPKRTAVKSGTYTNLGFNGKPVNRDLQDHSDILSVDSNNEIFPDQPTDADHLEDSILGSMFKSNRRSMKQAVKPVEVESSSSTLFKSSVNAKDVKKSHGASAASAQPNEIDFDTSMQDDWEGSDSVTSINKVDKPKDDKIGGKTLGKDVATSSLPFAVAQDNEVRWTGFMI